MLTVCARDSPDGEPIAFAAAAADLPLRSPSLPNSSTHPHKPTLPSIRLQQPSTPDFHLPPLISPLPSLLPDACPSPLTMKPASKHFCCTICQRGFTRIDHLKRHHLRRTFQHLSPSFLHLGPLRARVWLILQCSSCANFNLVRQIPVSALIHAFSATSPLRVGSCSALLSLPPLARRRFPDRRMYVCHGRSTQPRC